MKEVIRYQADSGNVYDTKEEAFADDADLIQHDLDDLLVLDDHEAIVIARYILTNFTRKEK